VTQQDGLVRRMEVEAAEVKEPAARGLYEPQTHDAPFPLSPLRDPS